MGKTGRRPNKAQGHRRKKKRTHVDDADLAEHASAPRSLILRRGGSVAQPVIDLIANMRIVMEPYTARRLQERSKTKLKDLLSVTGPLGVTHLVAFSQTDIGTNCRFIRVPRGPTLTMRVLQYTLIADVARMLKHPTPVMQHYLMHSPLVVLNNFACADNHTLPIVAAMFQNMFPSVNVQKIKLSDCRRIVLFSYDRERDCIDFRHYLITASPAGLTRTVKKVIRARIPDLHSFGDISDYVLKGNASESEFEDGDDNCVELPQNFAGRGNRQSHQSAIRLREIGPRMCLQLLKVEEGVCDGPVIYNRFVKKTPEEIAALRKAYAEKQASKEARRRIQEENVKRKQQKLQDQKQKKRARREGRQADAAGVEKGGNDVGSGTDDDEWFRRETGLEPDQIT